MTNFSAQKVGPYIHLSLNRGSCKLDATQRQNHSWRICVLYKIYITSSTGTYMYWLLTYGGKVGAMTPPRRADIEHTPNPVFL